MLFLMKLLFGFYLVFVAKLEASNLEITKKNTATLDIGATTFTLFSGLFVRSLSTLGCIICSQETDKFMDCTARNI